MLGIIIISLSIYLDGFLTLYLPYLQGAISLLNPMLTIVSLIIIYPLYRKKEKTYFTIIFIAGIIYDLLYTNLLFFNAVLFVGIGFLTKFIYKTFEINTLKLLMYLPLIVIAYETATALILLTFNIVPITFYRVFYKISHSLILNIIYGELLFLTIKVLPKRWKKIKIN